MKILFYCQHVLGIGHFFRSMAVATALHEHQVLFVEGGEPLAGFIPPPHIERAFLPPLMMDRHFEHLETRGDDLERIQTARQRLLMDLFADFAPDILLIELFPFGRNRFRFELLPLLERIRSRHPAAKVICSLRDILVEKPDQTRYEQRVVQILNRYFDLLLIHADPQLVALDETFARVGEIRIPVHYTGFVTPAAPPAAGRPGPNRIVASSGGGKVGTRLLAATIQAVQTLPDATIRLHVFVGPFMTDPDRNHLRDLAAGDPRIRLLPFATDFPRQLSRAGLSVSMAGYNTCMDILKTRTKALVYPFPQNREQSLRAEKLAAHGFLKILPTLEVPPLAAAIRQGLQAPPPSPRIQLNLDGAADTAWYIANFFPEY